MVDEWDGKSERREYCAQHCQLNETAKKAVPRWAFLSSISAMLMLAIGFIGINETRLDEIKVNLQVRMADQQERYALDVRQFYIIAEKNRELLVDVKINQAEIKAKQNLVLKKIKITE